MNKIKILGENLANKIAAGEVVERITNVVKELVENSIDADAKNIKIELIDSGTKMIKVTDDGIGMNNIDARNAFLRHATSKIYHEEDLFFINSLGFRGEALPSIASVSKVKLSTSQGDKGITIEINGGKFEKESISDARQGTIIEVKDLFYNTPARLKYLKSEKTELFNTVNYIEKIALSHDNISFELINNNNLIIKTGGQNNLLKTIHEIYGLNVSKNMLEIKDTNNDYDIYGYISKPSLLKATKSYISTIVNGRVVKNTSLNKIINDAYHTYKSENKYPVVVLKIETDPTLIDVNIHPTKQDIKFSKMMSLEDLVFSKIKDVLYNALLIPEVEIKTKSNDNEINIKTIYPEVVENDYKVNEKQESFDFKEDNKNKIIRELELYPIGLVFGTYIVAQNNDAMYLIDQHAAVERINYEKILKSLSHNEVTTTELLIPFNIELSPSDYLSFNEHKNILSNMGFGFNDLGINTITVTSHPTWLIEDYEFESISKIVELVINLPKDFDLMKFNDKLAATSACKESVKGNTNITLDEMTSILSNLVKCDNPYNCPHGRPTIISFTNYELEKMFKRVMN